MKTKKVILSAALIILMGMYATISFGCQNIHRNLGPGNNITEERSIGNFTKIDIGGAFTVYLTQGNSVQLKVEADQEEIKNIITEVVGSTLKIYTDSHWKANFHEMTIYLTFKELEFMDFSGAVEVESQGLLTFAYLGMDVSGAAEIDLHMKADKFEAEFSGASEVDLSGSCGSGSLELSGASEFDAEELEFGDLHIEVSGASDVKVWATGNLYIDASGASSIRYKGNAKVSIKESGASSVKPL